MQSFVCKQPRSGRVTVWVMRILEGLCRSVLAVVWISCRYTTLRDHVAGRCSNRNVDSFLMFYYNDDRIGSLIWYNWKYKLFDVLFYVNDDGKYATGSSDDFRNECNMRTHVRWACRQFSTPKSGMFRTTTSWPLFFLLDSFGVWTHEPILWKYKLCCQSTMKQQCIWHTFCMNLTQTHTHTNKHTRMIQIASSEIQQSESSCWPQKKRVFSEFVITLAQTEW